MRIVVDVSPLSIPRTGIGNYTRGMVAGLAEAAMQAGHELVAFAPSGLRGTRRIREALAGIAIEVAIVRLPLAHTWRVAWSRLRRPQVERLLGRFDVFHFSDWMYPQQRCGIRATTIHDLVPLRFPQWTTARTRRMHAAKYRASLDCDVVFTNSKFTERDVRDRFGSRCPPTKVAYPAVDPLFCPDGPIADLGAPYVLSVGTLEPRKNLSVLLQGVHELRRAQPELVLAVVGASGWGDPDTLDRPGVCWLGYVPSERLAALYRGASALAYGSRFEGFGMPVVEAMASGAPVVCSSHESLDEACGDAAVRADPESSSAFAASLASALENRTSLSTRGIEHAGRFTQRACGEAVLAGYASCL